MDIPRPTVKDIAGNIMEARPTTSMNQFKPRVHFGNYETSPKAHFDSLTASTPFSYLLPIRRSGMEALVEQEKQTLEHEESHLLDFLNPKDRPVYEVHKSKQYDDDFIFKSAPKPVSTGYDTSALKMAPYKSMGGSCRLF
jgi:hypothetical protein